MSAMLNADGVANGGGVMEDFAMCPLVSGFVFVALSDFGSQNLIIRAAGLSTLFVRRWAARSLLITFVVFPTFYVTFHGSTR